MEGDKKGPLTGKVSAGQWAWKSCSVSGATGGATGATGGDDEGVASVEGQASKALRTAEGKVKNMQNKQKEAVDTAKKMLTASFC